MCFLAFITKQCRVLSHEAILTQEKKKVLYSFNERYPVSNFNHRKCHVRTLLCLQEEKEATNYET